MLKTQPWTSEEFRAAVARAGGLPNREAMWVDLLDEAHDAYAECSSQEVARRRGWIMARLGEEQFLVAAMPFVLETLQTAQEPYLLAAASSALVRASRPEARFGAVLLRAISTLCSRDDFIDLQQWGGITDDEAGPTALSIAVEALNWLACSVPIDSQMLGVLIARPGMPTEHRLAIGQVLEAQTAGALDPDDCCTPMPLMHRRVGGNAADMRRVRFEDQHGVAHSWVNLFTGKPSIVAFFYTRCENPVKCSLTITKLAQLQKLLADMGLGDTVQVAAISYDSDFDSPARMQDYAQARGLRFDERNHVLRVVDGSAEVRRYFGSGVNYIGSLVNWHRVELFLLDASGKPAVAYDRRGWDPREVADDLSQISAAQAKSVLGHASHATPVVWALFLALLPKCPICGATYLSVSGIAALPLMGGWVMYWPLALILLVVNLLVLAHAARKSGRVAPMVAASAGALIMAVPGLALGNDIAMGLGFMLVVLGTVMSVVRFARGHKPSIFRGPQRLRKVLRGPLRGPRVDDVKV